MDDRNDTFLQMYFRLIGQAMAHQSEMAAKGEASDFELFSALLAEDRPRRLKIVLAKQLSEMESLMVSFGGEDGSVIITDRNKKALAVLKTRDRPGKKEDRYLLWGRALKRYGQAAAERISACSRYAITWLTAWDLAEKK